MSIQPSASLLPVAIDHAIHASEFKYRRLFEASNDGIMILDVETGQIDDVNARTLELLDFSREEMIGRTIAELALFHELESNQSMLERVRKDGFIHHAGLPLETKRGRKIAVEFVSNLYHVGDRKVIQCNIRDITDRKRADDEIRALNAQLERGLAEARRMAAQFIEAQKMEVVGQLASGIAHDFNNLLAVIMGYSDLITSDLLALGFAPDSPVHRYSEEVRHASERAVGLTRQLLVFSRKETVRAVVLDPNDAVQALDTLLRRLVDEHIELTILLDPEAGRVRADAGYIGQVLMNLVVNARDAMPNGGQLTITTKNATIGERGAVTQTPMPAGAYVVLSVCDTGTGMTDDVKEHLFEAFFTTKALGKGTGLGLATCRTIIQQLDGYIGVDSAPGTGTTFRVYLPRVEQAVVIAAHPMQSGPLPGGTETLLVVEDEPSVRRLACGVLTARGYHVLAAPNGEEALRVAQAHHGPPIRLVVTDVIMPLMGGKIMAEWLKATYPDLQVLFTSGYSDDALAQHGVLDPAIAFLAKPYTPSTLTHKVRELLDTASS